MVVYNILVKQNPLHFKYLQKCNGFFFQLYFLGSLSMMAIMAKMPKAYG